MKFTEASNFRLVTHDLLSIHVRDVLPLKTLSRSFWNSPVNASGSSFVFIPPTLPVNPASKRRTFANVLV